jgi:hypothetical protein
LCDALGRGTKDRAREDPNGMIINTHLKTPVVWGWSALEFRLQANTWVKFFAEGFCRLYIKGELCRSYAKGL